MRPVVVIAAAMLAGCAPAPKPARSSQADLTQEAWYGKAVEQLTSMDRQAEDLFARNKGDEAAAMITAGEPWATRLLAVPHPTLDAMKAAYDLDDLYGRMLFANRNYGWARMMFQKNLARWRTWKPQTEETSRYVTVTEAAIAECDRRMTE